MPQPDTASLALPSTALQCKATVEGLSFRLSVGLPKDVRHLAPSRVLGLDLGLELGLHLGLHLGLDLGQTWVRLYIQNERNSKFLLC